VKHGASNHATLAFEQSLITRPTGTCVLRLFVAGVTARSQQAIMLVRHLCEVDLKGSSTMEVIDIYQQPELARINQIVATPTLLREYPKPVRRFIGIRFYTSN
jgi:circadian clock protein KaiB